MGGERSFFSTFIPAACPPGEKGCMERRKARRLGREEAHDAGLRVRNRRTLAFRRSMRSDFRHGSAFEAAVKDLLGPSDGDLPRLHRLTSSMA